MTRSAHGWLAASSIVACACGSDVGAGEAVAFAGAPIESTLTSPSRWSVAVRASPVVPARGIDAFELVVRDAGGSAVDGLDLSVLPWMPAHGHGASIRPEIKAIGAGTYVASNVELYMPGAWQLRITLRDPAHGTEEHATAAITIE